MDVCPSCGAINSEGTKFCAQCGANMRPNPASQVPAVQPAVNYNAQPPAASNRYNSGPGNASGSNYRPQPMSTGGLIAWSVITLLLCTIPGIVALVKASNVNSAPTAEEQQVRYNSAKTWCIVGTVLGCLYLIVGLIGMSM